MRLNTTVGHGHHLCVALLPALVLALFTQSCGGPEAEEAGAMLVPARDHQVTAYYFHTRARCTTCRTLEAYAREALQESYGAQLADGRLEWRTVNFHEPENRRFVQDYDLSVQSLVLVETQGGQRVRWKKLDRIWDLVSDREAYLAYVREETGAYVEHLE